MRKPDVRYWIMWLFLLGIIFIVFLQVISGYNISRLLSGRFRDVSVERLLAMLQRLECDVAITVRHKGRDIGSAIQLQAEPA